MHSLSVATVLLVCAAASLSVAAPMPGDTTGYGGGSLAAGNVGATHKFGDSRNSQIGGGVGWGPGYSQGRIHGQTDVWQSRDGNSRVYAGAGRSQVLSGPARGQGETNFNVGFEKRF